MHQVFRLALGPTLNPIQRAPGFFPRANPPGRGVDHPHVSSAKTKGTLELHICSHIWVFVASYMVEVFYIWAAVPKLFQFTAPPVSQPMFTVSLGPNKYLTLPLIKLLLQNNSTICPNNLAAIWKSNTHKCLLFVSCIIRRSRNNQHYALNCTTPLFNIQAPTYFGSSLPSSGSFLDPSELL
jgi:hypothetical protein